MPPGHASARWNDRPVEGGFVERAGVWWYRIRNVDRMPPFLTSVASSSDHWLHASSRGPLTAGRRNVRSALFPYRTEDRLHDAVGRVGGRTIVHVEGDDRAPWEPGSERGPGVRDVSRDLWRDVAGTALCSEDIEHDLEIAFRATWTTSARYGVVRRIEVENRGPRPRTLRVIDGVVDVLPADVDPGMEAGFSNLVDAYKTARSVGDARVGVFALSSVPVDRAEPSEALRATTVWCGGAEGATRLLTERQLDAARRGATTREESNARGERCAYLIDHGFELAAGASATWTFACDVDRDATAVRALVRWLESEPDPAAAVNDDVMQGRAALVGWIRSADGVQCTGDRAQDARHFGDVLYNSMRGGLFPLGHEQDRDDFVDHLAVVAPRVLLRHREAIARWPKRADVATRRAAAAATGDPDLERIQREYLPLALSRRHGDPSRPWNAFSILTRGPGGALRSWYEGNWRDIFQNWEALAISFPAYAEAFVARFVNASTADGYNPYRVSRDGVDWEVHDPDDPWSFIGYWGDHQIVYLTRLIERCEERTPGRLAALLGRRAFVYVDVPYRIRSHAALVADPHHTVEYDAACAARVAARVEAAGGEGKLVPGPDGEPLRVTLAEKLLVPFLVKLTNLVPGAGIWMNTQRPEWNDANNALVGRGASVVTACALWRHAGVLAELFAADGEWVVREAVERLMDDLARVLDEHEVPRATAEPTSRRALLDDAGRAGEAHRAAVYAGAFGAEVPLARAAVQSLLDRARGWLGATIEANRRADGLYHAYNLITLARPGRVDVRRLDPMLEGQVAVLGAGILDAADSLTVLDALRQSPLWCADRRSYLLYPDRELPSFLERNVVPPAARQRFPLAFRLIDDLLAAGHRGIVTTDTDGTLRFAADSRNATALEEALDAAPDATAAARDELLALYEEVFDHAAFTGRSSTFFGYEGLGCVYWHMVSKLALAIQETLWRARDAGADAVVIDGLRRHYSDVREGLGTHAPPATCGAFGIEPHSHTPRGGGARQPGMTGQVKEDILCRFGELGVRVRNGRVEFGPLLLTDEALEAPAGPCLFGDDRPAGPGLAFGLCGTPVRLCRGDEDEVRVTRADGTVSSVAGRALDASASAALLGRTGEVREVEVRSTFSG